MKLGSTNTAAVGKSNHLVKRTPLFVGAASVIGGAASLVGARVISRGDKTFKKVLGLLTLASGLGVISSPWIFGKAKDNKSIFWVEEKKNVSKGVKKKSSCCRGGTCGGGGACGDSSCGSCGGSCGGCGATGCGGGS